MKNILIKLVILAVIYGVARWAMAATQPQALGLVTAIIENKTLAQINTYTPTSKGQLVYCSDCVSNSLCVSSGTARGAWVIISSGTNVHCI